MVRAGDVVAIPVGVAHRNLGSSPDLVVVGAYPCGPHRDLLKGDPAEYTATLRAIVTVPLPECDPTVGQKEELTQL